MRLNLPLNSNYLFTPEQMENAKNNYTEAKMALAILIDQGFPDEAAALGVLREEHSRLEKKVTRLFHEADWWKREYTANPSEASLASMNVAQLNFQVAEENSELMWESWIHLYEAYIARKALKRKELEKAVQEAEYAFLLSENPLTETC